jgi:hypothetical protein
MPPVDPANDPVVKNLKQIALKGGEKGPRYDQGVLAVVSQIEREGHFTRDRMCGILCLMGTQQKTNTRLLTDEEQAKGQKFIFRHGWTLEQAIEYASGVEFAESMLSRFRKNE